MVTLLLSLLFAIAPFWEAKPPEQWDQTELVKLLTDSPWAQSAIGSAKAARAPKDVVAFFATASPIEKAEAEALRRARLRRKPGEPDSEDPLEEEYRVWLQDNRVTQIVIAIAMQRTTALDDESEIRRMEKDCVLQAGRKKLKMSGHFPPTSTDPYLRIAFPRQVDLSDKNLRLDLYLPGIPEPYRSADFVLRDMVAAGKLEL